MEFKRGDIGLFFQGDPRLQLWLPLNGNATDYSKNGYHGTVSGASLCPGAFGMAYDFASDNYITLGDPVNLRGPSKLTIMTWVSRTGSTAYGRIFARWGDPSTPYNYLLRTGSGGDDIDMYVSDNSTNVGGNTAITTPLNKWTLLTMTYDGNDLLGYRNNELLYHATGSVTLDTSSGSDVNIGDYVAGSGYTYPGKLSQVAMWNRDLSPSEISQYYNWATGQRKKWIFLSEVPPFTSNSLMFGMNF